MNTEKEEILKQHGILYEKYAPKLLFYARKFVSYAVAEDIVHDIFLNLWKKTREIENNETTASYMYKSVQNACINYHKREVLHQTYLERAIFELKMEELNFFTPEKAMIEQEQINAIYSAINILPEKSKEVFSMSYLEGKTNHEIAETLHISIRTVENHLYRSLLILRKEILFILTIIFLIYIYH